MWQVVATHCALLVLRCSMHDSCPWKPCVVFFGLYPSAFRISSRRAVTDASPTGIFVC